MLTCMLHIMMWYFSVTGDIQSHLQAMFYLLRSHDTIKVVSRDHIVCSVGIESFVISNLFFVIYQQTSIMVQYKI